MICKVLNLFKAKQGALGLLLPIFSQQEMKHKCASIIYQKLSSKVFMILTEKWRALTKMF